MQRKFKIILLMLFLLLALLAWRTVSAFGDFATGSSVERTSLRGLDMDAARSQLADIRPRSTKVFYLGGSETIRVPLRPQIDSALKRARGTFWSRFLGDSKQVPLRWTYKKNDLEEASRLVLRFQAAREARPVWAGTRLRIQEGRSGWRTDREALRQRLGLTLSRGGGAFRLPGKKVSPRVKNAEQYWRTYPSQLLVDQSDFRLYFYKKGQLKRSYPVAVGAAESPTPNGLWKIRDRAKDPAWLPPDWAGEMAGVLVPGGSPENPLVSRWMGIGDGVGIHGTTDLPSLGSRASKGCIRMDPVQVRELYKHVPIGTPLLIRK